MEKQLLSKKLHTYYIQDCRFRIGIIIRKTFYSVPTLIGTLWKKELENDLFIPCIQ